MHLHTIITFNFIIMSIKNANDNSMQNRITGITGCHRAKYL